MPCLTALAEMLGHKFVNLIPPTSPFSGRLLRDARRSEDWRQYMKYAIVESGGKQYKAVEGATIEVDKLHLE
ncbi:MAG: bL21 family ribosomal protein, partial [Anaerolineae bacterium]|nr:bL21 family ribosomal protein [Anaerolineae bacterium]